MQLGWILAHVLSVPTPSWAHAQRHFIVLQALSASYVRKQVNVCDALESSVAWCARCSMAEDKRICQWSKVYPAPVRIAGLLLALLDDAKEAPLPCLPAIPATHHDTTIQNITIQYHDTATAIHHKTVNHAMGFRASQRCYHVPQQHIPA